MNKSFKKSQMLAIELFQSPINTRSKYRRLYIYEYISEKKNYFSEFGMG
jgi:hypothetical protein